MNKAFYSIIYKFSNHKLIQIKIRRYQRRYRRRPFFKLQYWHRYIGMFLGIVTTLQFFLLSSKKKNIARYKNTKRNKYEVLIVFSLNKS